MVDLSGYSTQRQIVPKWFTKYSVTAYLVALVIVEGMFHSHAMPWYYLCAGIIAICVFFMWGETLFKDLSVFKIPKTRNFEKRIFYIALGIRVAWMFFIYMINMEFYGDVYGFENIDVGYYNEVGTYVSYLIQDGDFHFYDRISRYSGQSDISDMGYCVYMGFVYWLSDRSVIVLRLLKCVWSALTVVLMFRLSKRNFGEETARIVAIFCMLWPNFWYYCGSHLKETEMVFLCVLFVEQADQMLRSRQFTAWKVLPVLLLGATLFAFRTPLALVAFLSLIFSVVMSSSKVVHWGKRIIVGGLAVGLIAVVIGNQIEDQARSLLEEVRSGQQKSNMEWRSKQENGNAFAKYAGASVFAPLILTMPFPSMVEPYKGQDVQQLNHGGNFIKNILSGFAIFALVSLFISGRWRDYLLPLSFMLGYLVVLVFSPFAQSERFHQPVAAFELMFAAYGLSIAVTKSKYKRWFMYWCALMVVAAIAWNWFKLKGRGL